MHSFQGHTDKIRSLSINREGSIAISGGYDKTIMVWNLLNRTCDRPFLGR
jgi:WD40 repeat protein